MRGLKSLSLLCVSSIAGPLSLVADQPIMNMMPRWDGGYGFQILTETIRRSDLKQGDDVIGNGFEESIRRLHLEGVYTWDRAVRLTFKLPYTIEARREILGEEGAKIIQRDEGLGDLTLALPLKDYFNLATRTGSRTLTPQIRVPLGEKKSDAYQVADHVWGAGLSIGYETETYDWFFATSGGVWVFEDSEPTEWHGSVDLGWNARDHMQVLWESDLKWDEDDAFVLSAGPALYWRRSDRIHIRVEWKHEFISRASDREPDHGNGDRLNVGIGFVF